jgi:DNA-binding NtrC family response regulator
MHCNNIVKCGVTLTSLSNHSNVLIIDDEERFATMLAKRLHLRGYESAVRYDGESGLEALQQHAFKVVLLDLRLPGISGEEVLSRLKKEQPDLPVIILTGHGTDKDREVCMQLEAHAFMNKPVNISSLVQLFEEIFAADSQPQPRGATDRVET